MAVNALLANFGPESVNVESERWRYKSDTYHELSELQRMAREARVSFFTLDTNRGQDGGFGGNLEFGDTTQPIDLGVNPWSRMRETTRASLMMLAKETGGRSYHGVKKLDQSLRDAANGFFGIYVVGYYRSKPDTAEYWHYIF